MKTYWHELEQEEVDKVISAGGTVGELIETYKQPDWCEYPDALGGMMGCWSLMSDVIRSKISEDFCKDCDCFKK